MALFIFVGLDLFNYFAIFLSWSSGIILRGGILLELCEASRSVSYTHLDVYKRQDSQLSEILGQQGIVVARRTIAKYREALSIPPVKLRKTI